MALAKVLCLLAGAWQRTQLQKVHTDETRGGKPRYLLCTKLGEFQILMDLRAIKSHKKQNKTKPTQVPKLTGFKMKLL